LIASPASNPYSDTGLTSSTTYYYKVTAVDKAGNEGPPSSEVPGMTSEAPALPTMHVASIDMWCQKVGQNYKVYTKVTIVDGAVPAQLVSGATVYLELTLPDASTTVTYSGVTGADGTVTFTYGPTKNRGTYTSTVTDVGLTGWIYDPGASVTSKSITV
jgi:fibronectin type 3 domain-containing protein